MHVNEGFVTLLLFLISSRGTFQQFAGCPESYFLHEGKCTACPDRCATCVSHQYCTKCNSNNYGSVCQYTCQQDCEELCHKEHGYCTYGCADGRFPELNSPLCAQCPEQCTICKSLNECIECLPGYYGNTCETRCSNGCKMCYKTSGACLVCDEGYYDQDGQCRRCPDGCDSCSDDKNCSSCQEGYLKLKGGQCIMECPATSKTNGLAQTGYSKEDMTSRGCTYKAEGQRFMIKTRKPCIQYITCSPNILCTPEYEGKSACGTIQTYKCSQSCRQVNESYFQCEPTCTLTEESLSSLSFCFFNEEAFSVIKLSTESECSNVSEDPSMPLTVPLTLLVAQSVAFVLIGSISLILFIFWKKRCRASRTFRKEDVDVEENTALQSIEGENEESADSQTELGLNHTSQNPQKKKGTSDLNINDSIDEPFANVETEGNPDSSSVSVGRCPISSANNVTKYPYRRDIIYTECTNSRTYLGKNMFLPLKVLNSRFWKKKRFFDIN